MSAQPLRVAVDMTFPNRNSGGTGVYTRSLIAALQGRSAVTVCEIACEDVGTAGTLRWLAVGARRKLKHVRPDLLHCPAFVAPWRSPVPLIITIHDAGALRFPQDFPLEWRFYNRFLLPPIARRAARLIVPSEFARREVARYYRVPQERIAVTYEAAQPQYKPQPQDAVRRYRAGLPTADDAGSLLLFVGAPVGRKNLDVVLRALARAEAMPESPLSGATLLICGAEADHFPGMRDRIARHGLSRRVRWLGHVASGEMPLLYAAADALVYPSLYEGFGLPPLEAMAVGLPVVASRASCLPEVLGDAALLVPPHDDAAFAGALDAVLTRPQLRLQLIEGGKARAALYSWERCAEDTEAVYRAAVS